MLEEGIFEIWVFLSLYFFAATAVIGGFCSLVIRVLGYSGPINKKVKKSVNPLPITN